MKVSWVNRRRAEGFVPVTDRVHVPSPRGRGTPKMTSTSVDLAADWFPQKTSLQNDKGQKRMSLHARSDRMGDTMRQCDRTRTEACRDRPGDRNLSYKPRYRRRKFHEGWNHEERNTSSVVAMAKKASKRFLRLTYMRLTMRSASLDSVPIYKAKTNTKRR